jgi:hypothetical protein
MAQAWTSGKDPCQLILSETPPLDETWQDCELRTRTSLTHKQTQQLDTEYRVPSCEPGCLDPHIHQYFIHRSSAVHRDGQHGRLRYDENNYLMQS